MEAFEQVARRGNGQGPCSFACKHQAAVRATAPTALTEGNVRSLQAADFCSYPRRRWPVLRSLLACPSRQRCAAGGPCFSPCHHPVPLCPKASCFAWVLGHLASGCLMLKSPPELQRPPCYRTCSPTVCATPAPLSKMPVAPSRPIQVEILGGNRFLPFKLNSVLYWFHSLLLFKKSRTVGDLTTGQQDCLQLRFRMCSADVPYTGTLLQPCCLSPNGTCDLPSRPFLTSSLEAPCFPRHPPWSLQVT